MARVGIVWDLDTGDNVAVFATWDQANEFVRFLDSMGVHRCSTWAAFLSPDGRLSPAAG